MQEQENKVLKQHERQREALLRVLNNVGVIGAVLAAVADIIFVIIFVVGVEVEQDLTSSILFATVNALVGVLINALLRYQGQKYAEIENEELRTRFYEKQIKEKRGMPLGVWNFLNVLKDIAIKGGTAVFGIFGVVYISIEGSKNPVQILITLVTLVLFACFGLMSMNTSYCRYYNKQVPYMKLKINEKENKKNGNL